jgi:hypothetical protein
MESLLERNCRNADALLDVRCGVIGLPIYYLFFAVTMNGTTLIIRWNWQKLFSYGEVACFVSAWAIGLLLALQNQRENGDRPNARSFASAADTLGIQATLSR